MALITCPNCGQSISDKAIKCPKCSYSIIPISVEPDNTPPYPPSLPTYTPPDPTPKKKKNILKIVIPLALLLIIGLFLFLFFTNTRKLSIHDLALNKWKLVDEDDYLSEYEGTLSSDEMKPFIAVIGSYTNKNATPQLVYMENGSGTLHTYEHSDDDPSTIYTPIGYMTGRSVSQSNIKNIDCSADNYYDYTSLSKTSCYVDIDIEMKQKQTGILFIELKEDQTNNTRKNVPVTIINGIGSYSYYLSDLPLKSRGLDVSVTPKFFCNASSVSEKDYTVTTPFSIDKDEGTYVTSFSGKKELKFNEYKTGFILYTRELLDGGPKEERGVIENTYCYLNNSICTLSTYTSGDPEDKLLSPTYDLQIVGFVTWEKYNKN